MAKEQFKTYEGVFDNFTNRTLFELASQGHFEGLESPISIGKESNVFTALAPAGRVIIKIYRLETCDFNRMYEYIRTDPRFSGLRRQRRKVIFAWCQREYRNLLNARDAGMPAPLPLAFKNNVLVEEFIGSESQPAPKLKDQYPKNPGKFFQAIVKSLQNLYHHHLTHGDLSAFNILNHQEKPVFIDLSHATTTDNPRFRELFERDIKTICQFFIKKGLKIDTETIIKKIQK